MSIQALQFPPFQKAMRVVTAITQDFPALVTTQFPHQYITGMIVRIDIPWDSAWIIAGVMYTGMPQINGQQGIITILNATQFYIDIDTSSYDPFVYPPMTTLPNGDTENAQWAQVVPVGEVNELLLAATQNVLPYP